MITGGIVNMISRNVKKVLSASVLLAVGMTIGATGEQLWNSHSAKKDLKRDIASAQEYSNIMRVLADIYYKQAECYDREELAKLRRENGDLLRNGANNIEELTRVTEEIDKKIFISEKDRKNIVKLEQTLENADFDYWKDTVEIEKAELEKMKTGY